MTAITRLRTLVAGAALRIDTDAAVPTWCGRLQGVSIAIAAWPDADGTRVRFEVELPPWRKSLVLLGSDHAVGFDGVLTMGDATFDTAVLIAASTPSVLGCFDTPARAHVIDAVGWGAYAAGGVLRCERRLVDEPLEPLLSALLNVAEHLNVSDEVANQVLVRMSRMDPNPDVRRALSRYLLADGTLRELDAVRQIQAATVADEATFTHLTLRLHDALLTRAARAEVATRLLALFPLPKLEQTFTAAVPALQRHLLEVIVQWAETADAHQTSFDVATHLLVLLSGYVEVPAYERVASAFARCGTLGTNNRDGAAFDVLVTMATRTLDDVVLFAVLRALVAQRHHPDRIFIGLSSLHSRVERLLPQLATKHPTIGAGLLLAYFERIDPRAVSLRVGFVRAIAATKDVRASEHLVKHLDTPYDELQFAVIRALGVVGTLSAVAALKPFSEGFFRASELKDAAQAAIAAIRERDGARSLPGALSIADVTPGGLAVKDDG